MVVTFHIETLSQKRIGLPENQFDYKQIQGAKFTELHRNQYVWKKLITKKCDLKTLLKPVFKK